MPLDKNQLLANFPAWPRKMGFLANSCQQEAPHQGLENSEMMKIKDIEMREPDPFIFDNSSAE